MKNRGKASSLFYRWANFRCQVGLLEGNVHFSCETRINQECTWCSRVSDVHESSFTRMNQDKPCVEVPKTVNKRQVQRYNHMSWDQKNIIFNLGSKFLYAQVLTYTRIYGQGRSPASCSVTGRLAIEPADLLDVSRQTTNIINLTS